MADQSTHDAAEIIRGSSFRVAMGQRSMVGADWADASEWMGNAKRFGRIRWYGDAVARFVMETADGRLIQFSMTKQTARVRKALASLAADRVGRRSLWPAGSAACAIRWQE